MTSFRWRCCLAALLIAAAGSAWAGDGTPAASDCDMLCRLQAYMTADHMVAFVPVEDAKPAVKPRKTARRAAAKAPKAVARKTTAGKTTAGKTTAGKTATDKIAAPRTAVRDAAAPPAAPAAAPPAASIAVAAPVRPAATKRIEAARPKNPPPRLVATAQPVVSAPPKPASRANTWQRRALIPGSAPMMAAQFAPVQR